MTKAYFQSIETLEYLYTHIVLVTIIPIQTPFFLFFCFFVFFLVIFQPNFPLKCHIIVRKTCPSPPLVIHTQIISCYLKKQKQKQKSIRI
jgi:hypothetical protein